MKLGSLLKSIGLGLLTGIKDKTTLGGVAAIAVTVATSPEVREAGKQLAGAIASGNKLAVVSTGLGLGMIVYQRATAKPAS
ncbi:hypothetical protein [Roseisolibacter sp. H3M3-2]|uniref:hypothetical protein n=1 Tax=Roseisolibacter sp. H3M3-2 TaxID=3031323 RepID=UPI0023DC0C4E|nr:hypothetical protein [Roseisolibacter sp. H3M3-2]MDF1506366.1 hypothetical protein [Roseisolibacter sp. H3M3-2]